MSSGAKVNLLGSRFARAPRPAARQRAVAAAPAMRGAPSHTAGPSACAATAAWRWACRRALTASKLAEITYRPNAGSALAVHWTTRAVHRERAAARDLRGNLEPERLAALDRAIRDQPAAAHREIDEDGFAVAPSELQAHGRAHVHARGCGASRVRGRASAARARAARRGGPAAAPSAWCRCGAASCAACARRARGSRSGSGGDEECGSWRSRIRFADAITRSQRAAAVLGGSPRRAARRTGSSATRAARARRRARRRGSTGNAEWRQERASSGASRSGLPSPSAGAGRPCRQQKAAASERRPGRAGR